MRRGVQLFVAGLGLGYAPIAPGTVASLVTLLLFIFFPAVFSLYTLSSLLIFVGLGVYTVNLYQSCAIPTSPSLLVKPNPQAMEGVLPPSAPALSASKSLKDPAWIVIDEMAGMFLILLMLPSSVAWWVSGFTLFRLFDIWKPPPIRKMEQLPGGWGVMADDLMAAAYTILILRFAGYIIHTDLFSKAL